MIIAAVAAAVLETEPKLGMADRGLFRGLELGFGAAFSLEFLARGWCAGGEARTFRAAWASRMRWLFSVPTLIDILALAPTFFATTQMPTFGLRLLRMLRILRIARLGRFSRAWRELASVIGSRRDELLLTLFVAVLVMLVSSTALYLVEGDIQPAKFGSIPRALWWSVVTLTTIGYGDVAPVTPLGKVLAGITAFLGVGLIAAPAGILAGAFSEASRGVDRKDGRPLNPAAIRTRGLLPVAPSSPPRAPSAPPR